MVLCTSLFAGCSNSQDDCPPSRTQSRFAVSFVGTVDPSTGVISISPTLDSGIGTQAQALTSLPVVQDGVPGFGPSDTLELVTESAAVVPDGCGAGLDAFQGGVRLRSFHSAAVLRNVYAEITQLTPTGHEACNSAAVPSLTPPDGATISNQFGLFPYGIIGSSLTAGNHALASWSFRMADSTPFTFVGRVVGDVVPTCSGRLGLPGPASTAAGVSGKLWYADLDGDGRKDVAIATSTGASVMLARPGGTFATPVSYASALSNPSGVAVGDLNNDGRPDLAFAGWYAVSVRLNNGDGTFAPGVTTSGDGFLAGLAVVDVNGDGWNDLVSTSGSARGIAYFRNRGTGSFFPQQTIGAGDNLPFALIAGDLTGDGRPEIVSFNSHLGGYGTSFSVYWNLFGSLSTGTEYLPSIIPFSSAKTGAILDFTGDGTMDLVMVDNLTGLFLLRGNGTVGGLSYMTYLNTGSQSAGTGLQAPVAADLDGDGILDLAAHNVNLGTISLLRRTGASLSIWKTLRAGTEAAGLVASDLDGDLDVDLLVSGSGFLHTFENRGADKLDPYDPVATPGSILAAADLNRDGRVDIVTGSSIGFGAGDGTFSAPYSYSYFVYNSVTATTLDLDCDGRNDVVYGTSTGRVDGLFGPASGTRFSYGFVSSGTSGAKGMGAADLDGDGRTDLAVANSDGTASIFRSDCTRTPPRTMVSIPTTTVAMALGDVTADGVQDLVVLSTGSPGFLGVLPGVGNGTFAARIDIPLQTSVTWQGKLALGDLDHDGDLDVVTGNGNSNSVTFLYGTGGSLATQSTVSLGKVVTNVALGDVSSDGLLDVVATHSSDNLVSVLVTPAAGVGNPTLLQWFADEPKLPVVADVNGDGWDEVLYSSQRSASTNLLLRQCLPVPP